ncbi:3-oxoadipate enol-lactonase 2 [Rhodobacteraceae bacterium THAF1]|uniref:3-oxoadipate enol-lactonase n=1 Tax=Palleronia sp. THAF1 TaxID=2587842 RepID=UPI000F4179D4|nr:3-oxoadipate enol-lactonase [Palleronia sp. THAF1]QFU09695.1 3-oxoadipate enol-lactonase 2 [Palleronia sp. THAF1]VDC17402.1 3-oxoadipate enol-lactonase 2 [Rhodobacteraceae bacterium THAF1]
MPEFAQLNGTVIHYAHRPGAGRPLVFLNSLGTDFRIWDAVIDRLAGDHPILRMDKRGHGLSRTDPADTATYAADVAALMDARVITDALVCSVSVGGLIAQQLTLTRPDLVAGLILSNTGAKIGDHAFWTARLDTLAAQGLDVMADVVMERWFSHAFRTERPTELAGYHAMLSRTPTEGYATCCAAIRDTDLRSRLAEITKPAICIAGSDDLSTPPELLAGLADALPDAECRLIDGGGHLPCIEAPDAVVRAIHDLLARLG